MPWFIQLAIVILSVGVSIQQANKLKKQLKRLNSDRENPLYTTSDPLDRLGVVYGVRRVGGVKIGVFSGRRHRPKESVYEDSDLSQEEGEEASLVPLSEGHRYGKDHKYLYAVFALSHGPVTAISNPLMDGKPIEGGTAYKIEYGLGSPLQSAGRDSTLLKEAPEFWDTDTGNLAGVAYAVIRITAKTDGSSVFGEFTFDVQGRSVFDPRTGITKWSENPALCMLDYLTNSVYGARLDINNDIDLDSVISLANYCEGAPTVQPPSVISNTASTFDSETAINEIPAFVPTQLFADAPLVVSLEAYRQLRVGVVYTMPDGSTSKITAKSIRKVVDSEQARHDYIQYRTVPGDTEFIYLCTITTKNAYTYDYVATQHEFVPSSTRYSCNGELPMTNNLLDNIRLLANTYSGSMSFVNGKATLLPDEVEAPVYSFDESTIVGDVAITIPDATTVYNKVVATYFDPNKNYDNATQTVISRVLLDRDGGVVREGAIDLSMCDNYIAAGRIAVKVLNKSRHSNTTVFSTLWSTLQCTVNNVITVSYQKLGWVDKEFRIMHMSLPNTEGVVKLTCVPYFSADYVDLTPNTQTGAANTQTYDLGNKQSVSNIAFKYTPQSLEYVGKLSWTGPPDYEVDKYAVRIGTTVNRSFRQEHLVWVNAQDGPYLNIERGFLEQGKEYTFRILWSFKDKVEPKYKDFFLSISKAHKPIGIAISPVTSPYGLSAQAIPSSAVPIEQTKQLIHLWYVTEYDGITEPTFDESYLVYKGTDMAYTSGLLPGKEYRLWVKTLYGTEASDHYPTGNGIPFTTPSVATADIVDLADTLQANMETGTSALHVEVQENTDDIRILLERAITDTVNIGKSIRNDADRQFEIQQLTYQINNL